jgi:hypothetical protein
LEHRPFLKWEYLPIVAKRIDLGAGFALQAIESPVLARKTHNPGKAGMYCDVGRAPHQPRCGHAIRGEAQCLALMILRYSRTLLERNKRGNDNEVGIFRQGQTAPPEDWMWMLLRVGVESWPD